MNYLVDTNVLCEPKQKRPESKVVKIPVSTSTIPVSAVEVARLFADTGRRIETVSGVGLVTCVRLHELPDGSQFNRASRDEKIMLLDELNASMAVVDQRFADMVRVAVELQAFRGMTLLYTNLPSRTR